MWLCIGTAHSKLVIMGSHHVLLLYLKAEIWTLFPPTCAFRGTVATHHHPTEVMYNLSQYVHTVDTDIALTSLICLCSFFSLLYYCTCCHMLQLWNSGVSWVAGGEGRRRSKHKQTKTRLLKNTNRPASKDGEHDRLQTTRLDVL